MKTGEEFVVLDAEHADDLKTWLGLWQAWTEREVFAHPHYLRLFAKPSYRILCAVFRSAASQVLFPFLLRPLGEEAWTPSDCDHCDVTSPYGYGGPYLLKGEGSDGFWDAFDKWAAQQRVVSCIARLALFPELLAPFRGEVVEQAPNVVCSLELSLEDLWMRCEHKVRKNVKKAMRSGLEVRTDLSGELLPEFLLVYRETMRRRNASEEYDFSDSFFSSICSDLEGSYAFFHVLMDGRLVSTELVLVSEQHLYSFLGGTLSEAFSTRPNDLLKQRVIEWGVAAGKKTFVLGGGASPGDGIFRYKRSFAPDGVVPFRTGRRVFDQAAYDGHMQERRRSELARGVDWEPRPEFFPAYRG